MSLGLGVLLATILVLIAWQVDKRRAWRALGVLVLSLIILSGLGALAVRTWTNHKAQERLEEAQARAKAEEAVRRVEAQEIREGKLQSLAGVSLGQSRAEVEYAYGKPDKDVGGLMQWSDGNIAHVVVLTESGHARVILCGTESPYDLRGCGNPAGLSLLAPETEVVRILGLPSKVDFKDAMKIAHYGSNGTFFDVAFAQGKVRRFILFRDPKSNSVATTRGSSSPIDDINRLTKAWDAAFLSGLTNSRNGRKAQACEDFRRAGKLVDEVAALSKRIGSPELERTTLSDAKKVHRYTLEECGTSG